MILSIAASGDAVAQDARWMRPAKGLPEGPALTVYATTRGQIWMGGTGGLAEITDRQTRTFGASHGLADDALTVLTEDSEGNLWIGTRGAGIMKLSRTGFTSYGLEDGLRGSHISAVIEKPGGDIYIATNGNLIHRFDGRAFVAVRPNIPPQAVVTGHRTIALIDHRGEFWVPTSTGLYRFPAVRRLEDLSAALPSAVYTTADGLADDAVYRLFEDSRGDIWIGAWAPGREVVTRWDRQKQTFHRYSDSDGLPTFSTPLCFAEDRSGTVWIGFREGVLARQRRDAFERVVVQGVRSGSISDLYLDSSGRMWVASPGGAGRIDQPDAEVPRVVTYSQSEGLNSPFVNAITEDNWGRLYFASAAGVDRLEVDTGRITHYTSADGLPGRDLVVAQKDRAGALWFAMDSGGLARFVPDPPRDYIPPSIFIADVRRPVWYSGSPRAHVRTPREPSTHRVLRAGSDAAGSDAVSVHARGGRLVVERPDH
jgi:ligand-binding sensor domain-containing protein